MPSTVSRSYVFKFVLLYFDYFDIRRPRGARGSASQQSRCSAGVVLACSFRVPNAAFDLFGGAVLAGLGLALGGVWLVRRRCWELLVAFCTCSLRVPNAALDTFSGRSLGWVGPRFRWCLWRAQFWLGWALIYVVFGRFEGGAQRFLAHVCWTCLPSWRDGIFAAS